MSTPAERAAKIRTRFALTGELPSHSRSGYNIGCRCRTCRDAHNAYQRDRRAGVKPASEDWGGEEYYAKAPGGAS